MSDIAVARHGSVQHNIGDGGREALEDRPRLFTFPSRHSGPGYVPWLGRTNVEIHTSMMKVTCGAIRYHHVLITTLDLSANPNFASPKVGGCTQILVRRCPTFSICAKQSSDLNTPSRQLPTTSLFTARQRIFQDVSLSERAIVITKLSIADNHIGRPS